MAPVTLTVSSSLFSFFFPSNWLPRGHRLSPMAASPLWHYPLNLCVFPVRLPHPIRISLYLWLVLFSPFVFLHLFEGCNLGLAAIFLLAGHSIFMQSVGYLAPVFHMFLIASFYSTHLLLWPNNYLALSSQYHIKPPSFCFPFCFPPFYVI